MDLNIVWKTQIARRKSFSFTKTQHNQKNLKIDMLFRNQPYITVRQQIFRTNTLHYMHQQLTCSVRSGLVVSAVSDLSRKENNLLLVCEDISEREVVFQIKKKSLMDGYVLLRGPLEKIETFPKIIVEILITEWGKSYYFI